MNLIFIYGLPAAGKLTVARELSTLTGYKLFHNHLTVDLLISVFDFGSPAFIGLREEIWLSVVDRACRAGLPGLIFTFNPESTVRTTFMPALAELLATHGSELLPVELMCPLPELRSRLGSASRAGFRKLTSAELFDRLYEDGCFRLPGLPKAEIIVDTSLSEPLEAAQSICSALRIGGR